MSALHPIDVSACGTNASRRRTRLALTERNRAGLLLAFYMTQEMLLLMAYMAGGQSAAEAWKEIP
jgi:hypothetical protein